METKTKYPSTEAVLNYFEENAPAYWRISYEYPDFIGVWHGAFISDFEFIFIGDTNGYFAFNDQGMDKVSGAMENLYTPKEIFVSFWKQMKEFYPNLVINTNFPEGIEI